jgi:hypothetical protein
VLESVLSKFEKHIDFSYSCFDRVVLHGYLSIFFFEGCVIKLLSNLEFKKYTIGILKTYTYQLNQHINKVSEALVLSIHW